MFLFRRNAILLSGTVFLFLFSALLHSIKSVTPGNESGSPAGLQTGKYDRYDPGPWVLVNSPANEFAPSAGPDGSVLFFNTKRGGDLYQNIYETHLEKGVWSLPVQPAGINSKYNDEAPCLFIDGNGFRWLFWSSDRDGSREMPADEYGRIKVSYDLYYSKETQSGWSAPQPVPGVNSYHHERAPALSGDGSRLYFTRWEWGKMEGAQVFYSIWEGDRFSPPKPMGPPLDTTGQIAAIHPAPDDSGFYFSAQDKDSLGGWDIYYISSRIENSGTAAERMVLGLPVHLNSPINSAANEAYFSVKNGFIFLASDRGGPERKFDLYSFPLPSAQSNLFVLKSRVTDKTVAAQVEWTKKTNGNNETTRSWSRQLEIPADGRFIVESGPEVSTVDVFVNASGYLPFYRTFLRSELEKYSEIELLLQPQTEEEWFELKNLYFDHDSSELKPETLPYLNQLAKYLKQRPETGLQITGYADASGSESYNLKLSEQRALSVKEYLVKSGIESGRLHAEGKGETGEKSNKRSKLPEGSTEEHDPQMRKIMFRVIQPK